MGHVGCGCGLTRNTHAGDGCLRTRNVVGGGGGGRCGSDAAKFLRFVNLLVTDTTYLLDEALIKLGEIHTYQVRIRNREAWAALPAVRGVFFCLRQCVARTPRMAQRPYLHRSASDLPPPGPGGAQKQTERTEAERSLATSERMATTYMHLANETVNMVRQV